MDSVSVISPSFVKKAADDSMRNANKYPTMS